MAAFISATERVRQFLEAVRKGDKAAAEALLHADPALVNACDENGVPAVRLAAYYRQAEIAKLLIERDATLEMYDAAALGEIGRLRELAATAPDLVNSYSSDGATPLGLAAFFGHLEAVELLLDRGAQINALATNPAFPFAALHSAMAGGHHAVVMLLLDRGANVNVREGGGMTVLHLAAGLGNEECVRLLLERGASPSARTDAGKLPEDFANERNHAAVAALLAKARVTA